MEPQKTTLTDEKMSELYDMDDTAKQWPYCKICDKRIAANEDYYVYDRWPNDPVNTTVDISCPECWSESILCDEENKINAVISTLTEKNRYEPVGNLNEPFYAKFVHEDVHPDNLKDSTKNNRAKYNIFAVEVEYVLKEKYVDHPGWQLNIGFVYDGTVISFEGILDEKKSNPEFVCISPEHMKGKREVFDMNEIASWAKSYAKLKPGNHGKFSSAIEKKFAIQ